MLKKEKQVKLVPADKDNQEEMEICAKCYCDAAGDPEAYDAESMRNRLTTSGVETYYLAEDGDKIVGGVLVLYKSPSSTVSSFNGFSVLPEFRRQGYGSAIMLELFKKLSTNSNRVVFGVRSENGIAKALYTSLGGSVYKKNDFVEIWEKSLKSGNQEENK